MDISSDNCSDIKANWTFSDISPTWNSLVLPSSTLSMSVLASRHILAMITVTLLECHNVRLLELQSVTMWDSQTVCILPSPEHCTNSRLSQSASTGSSWVIWCWNTSLSCCPKSSHKFVNGKCYGMPCSETEKKNIFFCTLTFFGAQVVLGKIVNYDKPC